MSGQLKMGLKLAQRLQMTPQLQQSIKLLALPLMELERVVREEMLENPVLEEAGETVEETTQEERAALEEEPPDRPTWAEYTDSGSIRLPRVNQKTRGSTGVFNVENAVSTEKSLYDHLMWQIQMSGFSNQLKAHLNILVDHLDNNGYLKTPLEQITNEIDVEYKNLKEALQTLHTMDPSGVGARDLKECLLIQAHQHQKGNPYLIQMIQNHLPDLERKNYSLIADSLDIQEEEVMDLYKIITAMEPKPGRLFSDAPIPYVTPDVYVVKNGNDYRVSLNEEGLPHLRVAPMYQDMLKKLNTEEVETSSLVDYSTHRYLRHKMNSALWLIRSLNQRQRTIYKVTCSVVNRQKEFFDKGPMGIKPLVLKQVAEDVGIHPSTVSRVSTNKYVYTPHGLYELKYFFNLAMENEKGEMISIEKLKLHMKSYIEKEHKNSKLSDQDITDRLYRDFGVQLNRRWVAKNREGMGILPARLRGRKE